MEATVAERGQITLPKAVRDALGLTKGTRLKVELEGGRIVLRKDVGEAIGKLAASVSCDNFKNSVPDDDRHDAYASCWSAMNRLQQIKARPPAKAKRVVAVDYDDDSGDGQLGMPDWVPQRQKGWAGL